jgi:hypothetical protein
MLVVQLVHYGMNLVAKRATLFDVISTVFTAVTFHELFKEAALNGNDKLEFGLEWQELLFELKSALAMSTEADINNERVLRAKFDEIDTSGDGSLDEEELLQLFRTFTPDVTPQLIANLVRLTDEDGNGTLEWSVLHIRNASRIAL